MSEMSEKIHLDTLLEIEKNPSTTQRSLSRKLNISLGLTNAILKNLIKRGWIKAQKLSGRKILYLITPQGMARVTNLLYDRFRETQKYYQYTKELINSYLNTVYQQGVREVAIYGINQLAEIAYLSLLDSPLRFHSIITADSTAASTIPTKKKFLGHKVLTLSDFVNKYSRQLSEKSQKELVIISTVSQDKLQQEIKRYQNTLGNLKTINLEDIFRNLKI